MNGSILLLDGVKKYFPLSLGVRGATLFVRAVDGVSLSVTERETLALVGESGSGKSTLGKMVAGLLRPDEGRVLFRGTDIFMRNGVRRDIRHKIQAVFQNPDSSLNPRMMVYDVLEEAVRQRHKGLGKEEIAERVVGLLERVGLSHDHVAKYPHELSGGEKQRVAIARALALEPEVLVADEIVSALDVSVRAQVLNVLIDIKREYGLTVLFITHDMGLVWSLSDNVAVMYLGKIVEYGGTEEMFRKPLHPYTKMLLTSSPTTPLIGGYMNELYKARGEPPSPINPPPGCRFSTRCPLATDKCRREEPQLVNAGNGRLVACFRWDVEP